MKIITLTLNPAFDIHCDADGFAPYGESIVKITGRDAGGKGVNVSRALLSGGTENQAIVVVGEENGDEFCRMLEKDGLTVTPIRVSGRIRENITLHEKNNPETRISFGGFSVDKSVLESVRKIIGEVDSDTVITFTGGLPFGIETADALSVLREFKEQGAHIVIDSRSVGLKELISFKPWLIKPNRDEAEKYMKRSIATPENAADAAMELHKSGVENAMISLGGEGAVLACTEGCFYVAAPKIASISTIGAGDSMIAGFIHSFVNDMNPKDCLTLAVAYGSAACMREGTEPPLKEDINKLLEQVKSRRIL